MDLLGLCLLQLLLLGELSITSPCLCVFLLSAGSLMSHAHGQLFAAWDQCERMRGVRELCCVCLFVCLFVCRHSDGVDLAPLGRGVVLVLVV